MSLSSCRGTRNDEEMIPHASPKILSSLGYLRNVMYVLDQTKSLMTLASLRFSNYKRSGVDYQFNLPAVEFLTQS